MTTEPPTETADRIALVTGTSTGFGRLIAEALQRDGYRTYATMRDVAGRNAQPKRELEAQGIRVVELDVTSDRDVDRALGAVLAEAGHVDVLVNNAGAAFFGLTEAFTPDLVAKQYDVNVVGPLRVNRAILPSMRARKSGLVIYVSSVVGRFVTPFTGVYASSKWALEALAEASSYELRPFGVDVSIVEPSAYATNVFSAVVMADDVARAATYGNLAGMTEQLAAGMSASAGDPQEVADATLAIVHAAAGARPLRVPVGAAQRADGVRTINALVAPIQRGILEAYGMHAMLAKEPVLS